MAHEKLKKQYQEDRKKYERPWELWEYQDYGCLEWNPCWQKPSWHPFNKYRRKEPPFQPQYYSGLNWREAERLIGKMVEFSDEPDMWGWEKGVLVDIRYDSVSRFGDQSCYFEYIRTTPETYAHPTITIGGVELPRPETNALEEGTNYFCFDPAYTGRLTRHVWKGLYIDHLRLNNGCIHLTEDRAQAWASWWENVVVKAIKG